MKIFHRELKFQQPRTAFGSDNPRRYQRYWTSPQSDLLKEILWFQTPACMARQSLCGSIYTLPWLSHEFRSGRVEKVTHIVFNGGCVLSGRVWCGGQAAEASRCGPKSRSLSLALGSRQALLGRCSCSWICGCSRQRSDCSDCPPLHAIGSPDWQLQLC